MKNLIKTIGIAAAAAGLCAVTAEGRTVKGYSSSSEGQIGFTVDSIDFRKDLTRVYGKITGTPHTSNRIDKMTIDGLMAPGGAVWTDIDGIDMNRWFQWEDSGMINVEIDFPPLRDAGKGTVSLEGPKGPSTWQLTKPAVRKSTGKAPRKNKRNRK